MIMLQLCYQNLMEVYPMKKVLAILICLSMVMCFMPTIAFAEGDEIVTTDVASAQNEVQNGNDAMAGSEDGGNTGGAKNPDQGGTGNDNPAPTDNVAKVVKKNDTPNYCYMKNTIFLLFRNHSSLYSDFRPLAYEKGGQRLIVRLLAFASVLSFCRLGALSLHPIRIA